MDHTKEPWVVAEESFDNDGIKESVIRGIDGRAAIAVTLDFGPNNPSMREANARRIAACVNACEGSPTDALEEMQHRGLTFGQLAFQHAKLLEATKDLPTGDELREAGHHLEQVSGQRDELLAAVDDLDDCREILENLTESIRAHGNYTPESMIVFLEQARSSLNPFLWKVASMKGSQPVVKDSLTTETAIPAIVFYPAGSLGEEITP